MSSFPESRHASGEKHRVEDAVESLVGTTPSVDLIPRRILSQVNCFESKELCSEPVLQRVEGIEASTLPPKKKKTDRGRKDAQSPEDPYLHHDATQKLRMWPRVLRAQKTEYRKDLVEDVNQINFLGNDQRGPKAKVKAWLFLEQQVTAADLELG